MANYLGTQGHLEAQGLKDMHIEANRLRTFSSDDWHVHPHEVPPQSLAAAGLYFAGEGDKVQCFSCHGILQNWTRGDSPWLRHKHSYPQCGHVRTHYNVNPDDHAGATDGGQEVSEHLSVRLNSSPPSREASVSPAQGSSLQSDSLGSQSQDSLRATTADPGGATTEPRADGLNSNWQSVHARPPTGVRVQYDPRQALDETCPLCGLTIEPDESSITCGTCNVMLHIRCVASTPARAHSTVTVNLPVWMCDHCEQYCNRNCGICGRNLNGVRLLRDIVVQCTGCLAWHHFDCIRHQMSRAEYLSVYMGTPAVISCPNCR